MAKIKAPWRKRSAEDGSVVGLWLRGSDDDNLPVGYSRLIDAPEVAACVGFVAGLLGSMTLQLMRNTKDGDVRVRDELSRFVDIAPSRMLLTRQRFVSWIVATQMTDRHGSAFVLPVTRGGMLTDLAPMPGAYAESLDRGASWQVCWRGAYYDPADVLPFIFGSDPDLPWLGVGLRASLETLTQSLRYTAQTKINLSKPDYKPPLVVTVDTDSDLSDEAKKDAVRNEYLDTQRTGKPWIIPGSLVKIDTIKPLSLADLCIADNVALDKRSVASVCGVPAYILGVGDYDQAEFNNCVRTILRPRAIGIAQTLTAGLLTSPERYWRFNVRSLYAYDLREIADMYMDLYVRGLATGNEVRDAVGISPMAGLNELVMLENYIPAGRLGDQKKLIQTKEDLTNA